MPNDSSTGGYLSPSSISSEINDDALRDFLQALVAGSTAIPGNLVFPRWQDEPPNIPAFGTNWAAVGAVQHAPDTFAAIIHTAGQDIAFRNDVIHVLCSFYGPNSEGNAQVLSMGLQVAQNREQMSLAGYGLVEVDQPITTADLLHSRWMKRVDIGLRLRRTETYTYPVLDLLSAQGNIQDDSGRVNEHFISTHMAAFPLFGFDLNTSAIAGLDQGNWR